MAPLSADAAWFTRAAGLEVAAADLVQQRGRGQQDGGRCPREIVFCRSLGVFSVAAQVGDSCCIRRDDTPFSEFGCRHQRILEQVY
jgi:hypothetical protein